MAAASTTTVQRRLPKNGSTLLNEGEVPPIPEAENSLTNRALENNDPRMNIEKMKSQLETKAKLIQFLEQKLRYTKNETQKQGDYKDSKKYPWVYDTVIL